MRPTNQPLLFVMVGLPGSGKTSLAKELAIQHRAIRLTPDEWMLPLFGEQEANGKRDILEGRLMSIARQALQHGTNVILDFGVWSRVERSAIRSFAAEMKAILKLVYLPIDPVQQRIRLKAREQTESKSTFQISDQDLTKFAEIFEAPTTQELESTIFEAPPGGYSTWQDWMTERWPTSGS